MSVETEEEHFEGEELRIEEGKCSFCGARVAVYVHWTLNDGGQEYWDCYCDVCDLSDGDVC